MNLIWIFQPVSDSPAQDSDLRQLQEQRAAIARHLAWLDAEIAKAQGAPTEDASDGAIPAATLPVPGSDSEMMFPAAPPEAPLPLSKRGCWLVFASALLAAIAVMAWVVFQFWG